MKAIDTYLIATVFAQSVKHLNEEEQWDYQEILFQSLNGNWEAVEKLSQKIEVNNSISWILEKLRRNEE